MIPGPAKAEFGQLTWEGYNWLTSPRAGGGLVYSSAPFSSDTGSETIWLGEDVSSRILKIFPGCLGNRVVGRVAIANTGNWIR